VSPEISKTFSHDQKFVTGEDARRASGSNARAARPFIDILKQVMMNGFQVLGVKVSDEK
jgi:hypothetical protein